MFKQKSTILALIYSLSIASVGVLDSSRVLANDLETGTAATFGYVTVNDRPYLRAALSPDFGFGPLTVGLDINGYFSFEDSPVRSAELQPIVFRYLAYDDDDQWGIAWGRLQNITLGHGLLMDRFDTGSGGSNAFTSDKAGLRFYANATSGGFLNSLPVKMDWQFLWSARNVVGVRGSWPVLGFDIFGKSIVLGGTFVSDSDGVTDSNGVLIREPQNGVAADVGIEVIPQYFIAYTEYAILENHGNGSSIGIKGDGLGIVDYRFEYRAYGAGFAPGYFNQSYEALPFDFETDALGGETNGFFGHLGFSLFKDYVKAGINYESYNIANTEPLLTGSVSWKEIASTVGKIKVTQHFDQETRPVVTADILYKTGTWVDYLFHVKRVYEDFGRGIYTQSVSVEARANLGSLGLDFLK